MTFLLIYTDFSNGVTVPLCSTLKIKEVRYKIDQISYDWVKLANFIQAFLPNFEGNVKHEQNMGACKRKRSFIRKYM